MKNILNLFRPTEKEQQLESELNGTANPTQGHSTPPPRRGTAIESGADVSELMQLRQSLADIENKLQVVTHERDGLRNDLKASQKAISDLQSENVHLSHSLSKQIASSGLDGPIPGNLGGIEEEPKGLQRSIAAAKAEATKPQPLTRPTL